MLPIPQLPTISIQRQGVLRTTALPFGTRCPAQFGLIRRGNFDRFALLGTRLEVHMNKAITYLPFEDALDRFSWDTPRGAAARRPRRIKIGTPELAAFKTWCLAQSETTTKYAGVLVECVSAESCPPTAE
jgi:hypothetical protein